MRAYIVTGTTSGIGRAIAEKVVAGKDQLLSLSRSPDGHKPYWRNIQCDLNDHQGIVSKLHRLLEATSSETYQ